MGGEVLFVQISVVVVDFPAGGRSLARAILGPGTRFGGVEA